MTTRDFSRQSSLVPAEVLADTPVTVIGVGAVGRNVALQLAAIGATNITLVDFDTVEASNVTTQGYRVDQIGKHKATAVANDVFSMTVEPGSGESGVLLSEIKDRWRPANARDGEVVFCCVDSMASRRAIHRGVRDKCRLWLDARMLGEQCFVYAAATKEQHDEYEGSLYGDDEVEPGRCTARSTIYCASFCASAMVHQFARWLRGHEVMNVGGSLLEFLPF